MCRKGGSDMIELFSQFASSGSWPNDGSGLVILALSIPHPFFKSFNLYTNCLLAAIFDNTSAINY
jgi:hypothetical protein